MKNTLKYIIVLLISTVLTLLYGFCFGGEYSLPLAIAVFSVSASVLIFFDRKQANINLIERVIKIIIISVITTALTIGLYGMLNESSYTFIDEYETEITDVWLHGGRRDYNDVDLFFVTPDGEENFVTIYSKTPPSQGDKIAIYEYEGLFGENFYRYHGIAE